MTSKTALPIPPLEMRQLVGPTDPEAFDNSTGSLVFGDLIDKSIYEAVFDFGCGCGRLARKLLQQDPPPRHYVGIDLHRGMIEWCKTNLKPAAAGFEFHHHDVYNHFFNPERGKPDVLPLPAPDSTFSLVIGWSVFTHLTESQTLQYLHEAARILRPDGILLTTWFLFDKHDFAMLTDGHNALYVSYIDPSAVVIYDRDWVRKVAAEANLRIFCVRPPALRGYQWLVLMTPAREGIDEVQFPTDDAPRGRALPPSLPQDPANIGLPEPSDTTPSVQTIIGSRFDEQPH